MDQILNTVTIRRTDNQINKIIEKCKEHRGKYTMHFTQNEEFFLKTGKTFSIPHLKIHHDINNPEPENSYMDMLATFLNDVIPFIAPVIEDTEYYFDPAEPLRPVFYRLYQIDGRQYLYMARLDLSFKPHDCEITEMGNNDITHLFETQSIFLDADILPVEKIHELKNGRREYHIRQSVSQTWIGETGRGYFIQGIWMDSELTKFFTRLFLPDNLLTYPYYPFQCKYRTLSYFPPVFGTAGRKKGAEILDRAYNFISPAMREIEVELRDNVFSSDLGLFRKLKESVNSEWYSDFSTLGIKRYLNAKGMKEYELVF